MSNRKFQKHNIVYISQTCVLSWRELRYTLHQLPVLASNAEQPLSGCSEEVAKRSETPVSQLSIIFIIYKGRIRLTWNIQAGRWCMLYVGIYVCARMYKINKIRRARERGERERENKRQSLKQFLSRAVTHA